jgi:hypothetical protein
VPTTSTKITAHHRIFGDVLALIVCPEPEEEVAHRGGSFHALMAAAECCLGNSIPRRRIMVVYKEF